MPSRCVPTQDAIARLRERYDAGEPAAVLAQTLGVTDATFRKWRKQWGWPVRRSAKRLARQGDGPQDPVVAANGVDVAAAVAALDDDDAAAPTNERIAAALRRALYAEVAVLMADSGNQRGSEARARALASLGRTLAMLGADAAKGAATKETGSESDDAADAPPINVAELRRELARRLHLISEARDNP